MTIRDRFFTLPEILLIYAVWGVAQNGHRSGTEFGIFVDTEWTQKLSLFEVLGGICGGVYVVCGGVCAPWGGVGRDVWSGVWGCPGGVVQKWGFRTPGNGVYFGP